MGNEHLKANLERVSSLGHVTDKMMGGGTLSRPRVWVSAVSGCVVADCNQLNTCHLSLPPRILPENIKGPLKSQYLSGLL